MNNSSLYPGSTKAPAHAGCIPAIKDAFSSGFGGLSWGPYMSREYRLHGEIGCLGISTEIPNVGYSHLFLLLRSVLTAPLLKQQPPTPPKRIPTKTPVATIFMI